MEDNYKDLYKLKRMINDEEFLRVIRKNAKKSYEDLFDISKNIIMLSGTNPMWGSLPITNKENLYIELNPMTTKKSLNWAEERGFKVVATSDNFFPKVTELLFFLKKTDSSFTDLENNCIAGSDEYIIGSNKYENALLSLYADVRSFISL